MQAIHTRRQGLNKGYVRLFRGYVGQLHKPRQGLSKGLCQIMQGQVTSMQGLYKAMQGCVQAKVKALQGYIRVMHIMQAQVKSMQQLPNQVYIGAYIGAKQGMTIWGASEITRATPACFFTMWMQARVAHFVTKQYFFPRYPIFKCIW